MTKYILKRLLQSLITVLLVVTIVFLLLRLMPTDYYFTEDELMKLPDDVKEDRLRAAGLAEAAGLAGLSVADDLVVVPGRAVLRDGFP